MADCSLELWGKLRRMIDRRAARCEEKLSMKKIVESRKGFEWRIVAGELVREEVLKRL